MPTQVGFRSNVPGSNFEAVDEDNPFPVQIIAALEPPPGRLMDGTFTATAGAAPLTSTDTPCVEVLVQNDPGNTSGQDIYVGNASTQSMRITVGSAETITIDNVNKVWVKLQSGTPRVNWHARA